MSPPGADDGGAGPIASAARGRLDAIRRALVAEMTRLLARLDTTGGGLVSTKDALDNARRIRTQVLALLREDGLPVVIDVAEEAVADAVEAAIGAARKTPPAGLGAVKVTFDAEAKDSIARSVNGVLDEVAVVFRDAAGSVRKAMDIGVNTGVPLDELVRDVSAKLDTTFSRAKSAVEMAVRGAARLTTVQQAERGGDATDVAMAYLYDGPTDSKTRPFCRLHVGKVYSLAALNRLDNGTSFPVVPFAGGPGCRHRLSPLSLEDAKAEGYKVVK